MIYVGVWMIFFCFLLLNDALTENNLFIPYMDYKDNRSLSHIMYIFFLFFTNLLTRSAFHTAVR